MVCRLCQPLLLPAAWAVASALRQPYGERPFVTAGFACLHSLPANMHSVFRQPRYREAYACLRVEPIRNKALPRLRAIRVVVSYREVTAAIHQALKCSSLREFFFFRAMLAMRARFAARDAMAMPPRRQTLCCLSALFLLMLRCHSRFIRARGAL